MYQIDSTRSAHEFTLSRMKEVQDRETPAHTLKNRANKCKTCWGKKEVSIRKSSRPIVIMSNSEGFPLYDRSGGLIYSANPEVVRCHCQH